MLNSSKLLAEQAHFARSLPLFLDIGIAQRVKGCDCSKAYPRRGLGARTLRPRWDN